MLKPEESDTNNGDQSSASKNKIAFLRIAKQKFC